MAKSFTFTAPAGEIAAAIKRVGSTGKSHVEVLNGLHMTLAEGELILQSTDMSLILRERLPVQKAGEGTQVVLDAAKVFKGIMTLDGLVTFTATKEAFAIRNGSTTLNYVLGEVADYPKLPEGMGGGSAVSCHALEFAFAFKAVEKAFSRDQSRPVLCGVFLEIHEDALRMTATDSYRLTSDFCSAEGEGKETFGEAIVHGADLKKSLAFLGSPEKIQLSRFDKWVCLSADNRSAWLRAIDGQFPNYREFIPDTFEGFIAFPRDETLKAIGRMAKLSNRPVKLAALDDHTILASIGSDDPNRNFVESKLAVEGSFNRDFVFGINPQFFYDALETVVTKNARFHFINPLRPGLVTDGTWEHRTGDVPYRFTLVMPVRIPS